MENTKKFKTIIKTTWKTRRTGKEVFSNEFIKGQVIGMLRGIVGYEVRLYPMRTNNKTGYTLMKAECTQEQYDKFKEFVEYCYPELCEFDTKEVA